MSDEQDRAKHAGGGGGALISDCLTRVSCVAPDAAAHRSPEGVRPLRQSGTVCEVQGLSCRVRDLAVPVGSLCRIESHHNPSALRAGGPSGPEAPSVLGEVVGFSGDEALLMPFGSVDGVRPGCVVRCLIQTPEQRVGPGLLGRVLDGTGRPIDGKGPIVAEGRRPLFGSPPDAVHRRRITRPLATGIRAIDGFLTCGKGQRTGIFSGAGVGKSVLLGMIARHTNADVNVVALIGERGREVRDFLDRELGEEGLARSVVVVSTSYDPAPLRVKAAFVAATVADYFRDQGNDVMFLMDSVTRVAVAQREIGLSVGEPPTTRGYPPSVFALLPRLLERAGCAPAGTITGFYNVLVEGDDIDEPISDAARGVLDGHIWLDRRLAARRHYPAVSVLDSVSRLMPEVAASEHRAAASQLASFLAAYAQAEDLIAIGAYVRGTTPEVDLSIEMRPKIEGFLKQATDESARFDETVKALVGLAREADRAAENAAKARKKANPALSALPTPAAPPRGERDAERGPVTRPGSSGTFGGAGAGSAVGARATR